MRKEAAYLTLLGLILTLFIFLESCVPIRFHAKPASQDLIRIDGKFSFTVEIENVGLFNTETMEPISQDQIFFYLKEAGTDEWRKISMRKFGCDPSYPITIKKGQKTIREYSFRASYMLQPDKSYTVKAIYYPREVGNYYHDPNKHKHCPKYLCREHELVFRTDTLSKASEEELMWLKQNDLIQIYLDDYFPSIYKKDFQALENFIQLYPKSIFTHRAKWLYVRYVAFDLPLKDISIETIQKAIDFCKDPNVEKEFSEPLDPYLSKLQKKLAEIKNQ